MSSPYRSPAVFSNASTPNHPNNLTILSTDQGVKNAILNTDYGAKKAGKLLTKQRDLYSPLTDHYGSENLPYREEVYFVRNGIKIQKESRGGTKDLPSLSSAAHTPKSSRIQPISVGQNWRLQTKTHFQSHGNNIPLSPGNNNVEITRWPECKKHIAGATSWVPKTPILKLQREEERLMFERAMRESPTLALNLPKLEPVRASSRSSSPRGAHRQRPRSANAINRNQNNSFLPPNDNTHYSQSANKVHRDGNHAQQHQGRQLFDSPQKSPLTKAMQAKRTLEDELDRMEMDGTLDADCSTSDLLAIAAIRIKLMKALDQHNKQYQHTNNDNNDVNAQRDNSPNKKGSKKKKKSSSPPKQLTTPDRHAHRLLVQPTFEEPAQLLQVPNNYVNNYYSSNYHGHNQHQISGNDYGYNHREIPWQASHPIPTNTNTTNANTHSNKQNYHPMELNEYDLNRVINQSIHNGLSSPSMHPILQITSPQKYKQNTQTKPLIISPTQLSTNKSSKPSLNEVNTNLSYTYSNQTMDSNKAVVMPVADDYDIYEGFESIPVNNTTFPANDEPKNDNDNENYEEEEVLYEEEVFEEQYDGEVDVWQQSQNIIDDIDNPPAENEIIPHVTKDVVMIESNTLELDLMVVGSKVNSPEHSPAMKPTSTTTATAIEDDVVDHPLEEITENMELNKVDSVVDTSIVHVDEEEKEYDKESTVDVIEQQLTVNEADINQIIDIKDETPPVVQEEEEVVIHEHILYEQYSSDSIHLENNNVDHKDNELVSYLLVLNKQEQEQDNTPKTVVVDDIHIIEDRINYIDRVTQEYLTQTMNIDELIQTIIDVVQSLQPIKPIVVEAITDDNKATAGDESNDKPEVEESKIDNEEGTETISIADIEEEKEASYEEEVFDTVEEVTPIITAAVKKDSTEDDRRRASVDMINNMIHLAMTQHVAPSIPTDDTMEESMQPETKVAGNNNISMLEQSTKLITQLVEQVVMNYVDHLNRVINTTTISTAVTVVDDTTPTINDQDKDNTITHDVDDTPSHIETNETVFSDVITIEKPHELVDDHDRSTSRDTMIRGLVSSLLQDAVVNHKASAAVLNPDNEVTLTRVDTVMDSMLHVDDINHTLTLTNTTTTAAESHKEDEDLVKQMIGALIQNAIQHTLNIYKKPEVQNVETVVDAVETAVVEEAIKDVDAVNSAKNTANDEDNHHNLSDDSDTKANNIIPAVILDIAGIVRAVAQHAINNINDAVIQATAATAATIAAGTHNKPARALLEETIQANDDKLHPQQIQLDKSRELVDSIILSVLSSFPVNKVPNNENENENQNQNQNDNSPAVQESKYDTTLADGIVSNEDSSSTVDTTAITQPVSLANQESSRLITSILTRALANSMNAAAAAAVDKAITTTTAAVPAKNALFADITSLNKTKLKSVEKKSPTNKNTNNNDTDDVEYHKRVAYYDHFLSIMKQYHVPHINNTATTTPASTTSTITTNNLLGRGKFAAVYSAQMKATDTMNKSQTRSTPAVMSMKTIFKFIDEEPAAIDEPTTSIKSRKGSKISIAMKLAQFYANQHYSQQDTATTTTTANDMALKLPSKAVMQEFGRELLALKALEFAQGGTIIKLIGFVADPTVGEFGLLTELVAGGNLYDAICSNDFQINAGFVQRMYILSDIYNAFTYIHRQGFFHGDVKSHNILIVEIEDADNNSNKLRRKYSAKVSDFGSARRISSHTSNRTGQPPKNDFDDGEKLAVGTSGYTAPEILEGYCNGALKLSDLDTASDIFALAVVAHEVLLQDFHLLHTNNSNEINPWKGLEETRALELMRDGVQPTLYANYHLRHPEILEVLLLNSWQLNPRQRPTAKVCAQLLEKLLRQLLA